MNSTFFIVDLFVKFRENIRYYISCAGSIMVTDTDNGIIELSSNSWCAVCFTLMSVNKGMNLSLLSQLWVK